MSKTAARFECEPTTAGSAYFVVGAAWGWITALKHEVTKTRRTDGGSTTTIFYRRDAEDAENDGINHPGAAGINSCRRWAQRDDGDSPQRLEVSMACFLPVEVCLGRAGRFCPPWFNRRQFSFDRLAA